MSSYAIHAVELSNAKIPALGEVEMLEMRSSELAKDITFYIDSKKRSALLL